MGLCTFQLLDNEQEHLLFVETKGQLLSDREVLMVELGQELSGHAVAVVRLQCRT